MKFSQVHMYVVYTQSKTHRGAVPVTLAGSRVAAFALSL